MADKVWIDELGIYITIPRSEYIPNVPVISNQGTLVNPATGEVMATGGASSAVIDITAANVVAFLSGQNVNTTLAPGTYQVLSDADCYLLDSAVSGVLGIASSAAGYYSTAAGSLAAQTGLEFGTSDFTFEAFVQVTDVVPANNVRILSAGASGSNPQLTVYLNPKAGTGVLQVGLAMSGTAGAVIKANAFIDTTVPKGTALHHFLINVDRAGGSGTSTITYYLDKAVVGVQTYTEAATPLSLSMSQVLSSGRINIGSTLAGGTNYQLNGRVEDVKVYIGTTFDSERVTARADRGPERALGLPGDEFLTWWMSVSNSAIWANPANPECVPGYGNAVMLPTGDAVISPRPGGAFAASTNSPLILAHQPQLISVTYGNINVQPVGLGSGGIRFVSVQP